MRMKRRAAKESSVRRHGVLWGVKDGIKSGDRGRRNTSLLAAPQEHLFASMLIAIEMPWIKEAKGRLVSNVDQ